MSWVAAAVGTGAALQVGGAIMGSNAASKAAKAQQQAAEAYRKEIAAKEQQAVSMVKTPASLAAYDLALHGQEANVRRMEQTAAALDPALVEAGKQTTAMLQGKAAPVMGQIQAQRDRQRNQMLDQLRTQLGPGAETSSAGQNAIREFDAQTDQMMTGVQQQYLQQVSGLALGGTQTLGQALSQVNATLSSIQTQSPDAQAAHIIASFTGANASANEAAINAAGGEQAGQQIWGKALGGVGSGLMTLAAMKAGNKAADTTGNVDPSKPMPDGTAPGSGGMTMPALGDSAGFGKTANYSLGLGSGGAAAPGTLGAAVKPPPNLTGIPESLRANQYAQPYSTAFQMPTLQSIESYAGVGGNRYGNTAGGY